MQNKMSSFIKGVGTGAALGVVAVAAVVLKGKGSKKGTEAK